MPLSHEQAHKLQERMDSRGSTATVPCAVAVSERRARSSPVRAWAIRASYCRWSNWYGNCGRVMMCAAMPTGLV